jgi:hypothetical protein
MLLFQEFLKDPSSDRPAMTDEIYSVIGHNVSSLHNIPRILGLSADPLPRLPQPDEAVRKSNPWLPRKGDSLLAGIRKNQLSSWAGIADFVGNSRKCAQCSQR